MLSKFFDNLGPIPIHAPDGGACEARSDARASPNPTISRRSTTLPATSSRTPTWVWSPARRRRTSSAVSSVGSAATTVSSILPRPIGWNRHGLVRRRRRIARAGSLVTYEPQVNSDVFGMFQSMVDNRPVPWSLLVKDVPPELSHDLDYIVSMLDWEKNVDPEFGKHFKRFPVPVRDEAEMKEMGYSEVWVSYGSAHFSAKELTVLPGRTVVIRDSAAYGLILTQGRGRVGVAGLSKRPP